MLNLETRRLGRTEMKPKALGLGAGYLGDQNRSKDEAVATVHTAIDQGINFVDTSPEYGASEYRIGLALQGGLRDKVYLQTKVGSHPRYLRDFSRKATIWSLENSFKLLKTDYVDSVLIHGPRHDIETPLGHCMDVMLEWKVKGRIGHIGIGVRQHKFHKRAIETGEIDIILSFLDYTLLSQSLLKTSIPLALKNDVGIILASPLAGSLLAGPEPIFRGTTNGKDKLPPSLVGSRMDPSIYPAAHRRWEWCETRGLNIRDLAIQFTLNAPLNDNGIVLIGPSNPAELDQILSSATADISESVWKEFKSQFRIEI